MFGFTMCFNLYANFLIQKLGKLKVKMKIQVNLINEALGLRII